MALLMTGQRSAWLALLPCAALLLSCDGRAELGRVQLVRYEGDATCDERGCRDRDTGEAVGGAEHTHWIFRSSETSQHHPDGTYLYTELPLGDGVTARLEVDAEHRKYDDARKAEVHYTERREGEVRFQADRVRGVVILPRDAHGEDCDCTDGALELRLTDAGPDGVLDTEDDQQRRLTDARFGWGEGTFCMDRQRVSDVPEDGVDVWLFDHCPGSASRPDPRPRPEPDPDPYPEPRPRHDAGGCESSSSSSGGCGSSSSSGGCESDSSSGGCEGDSSSGGCEGDSSSDGGCEGDSSEGGCDGDSSESCEGDGSSVAGRPRTSFLSGPHQTLFLVGAVLLFLLIRRPRDG